MIIIAGSLEYSWCEDLEAPDTFHFFECRESPAPLHAHPAAPSGVPVAD